MKKCNKIIDLGKFISTSSVKSIINKEKRVYGCRQQRSSDIKMKCMQLKLMEKVYGVKTTNIIVSFSNVYVVFYY